MSKPGFLFAGSLLALAVNSTLADDVGGSPKADFSTDELSIPCVQVRSLSADTEGLFYDIVLSRRGSSFNYELKAAIPEDTALCQRIADFAAFEDDDFDDEDDDDDSDADLLAQCEADQDRSRVSIKARDLMSGDYFARITSGNNTIDSMVITVDDDEFEVDFDSDSDDVLEGAEAMEPDFIVGGVVEAGIFLEGDSTPVVTSTFICKADD